MARATFDFAGRSVQIDGSDTVVGLARDVLRHHECIGSSSVSAVLSCVDGPGAVERAGRTWSWAVPADITRSGADWFYYYGFSRVLHCVWDGLGLVRLHGALLWSEKNGGVLVVGDRHDGKSSVSAGWLDQGGLLATDDTVLLDVRGTPPLASGVRRELHLDPELAPALQRLDGLSDAEPYLPGRTRVRYDWVAGLPDQVVTAPVVVDAVLRTRIDADRPTSARRIAGSDAAFADILRTAVPDDGSDAARQLDDLRPWLTGLPVWEITWGRDLWSMPYKHRGYLDDLLAAER